MQSNQPADATDNAGLPREVVDLDVLGGWMDDQGLPGGPITGVEELGGGTQNVLLKLHRGGRAYVLRRGPKHLRPASNDVMRREQRVLAALAGSDVPHPGFVAGCTDETVMGGAVFYLMEPVDGFNATVTLPDLHAGDPAVRHAMGLEAVEAVARLGAVDHEAVGLADFGRSGGARPAPTGTGANRPDGETGAGEARAPSGSGPTGFLERQVPRWQAELDSYRRLDGYPGPEIPGVDTVAAWLDANRPTGWRPGIMHGDYHLANVLFAPDGPCLAAIVDWEMCTIGDPLLDLGWLLATWPQPLGPDDAMAHVVTGALGNAGGLPTRDELVAHYAERSDRDTSAIAWYTVLACFKLGIVLEGTHARACAGKAPKPIGDMLHAITLGLFARAHALIAAN